MSTADFLKVKPREKAVVQDEFVVFNHHLLTRLCLRDKDGRWEGCGERDRKYLSL